MDDDKAVVKSVWKSARAVEDWPGKVTIRRFSPFKWRGYVNAAARFLQGREAVQGPLTARDQSAKDAGCNCPRKIPYADWSHASYCPLFAAMAQPTAEQPQAPTDKTDEWEARQDAKREPPVVVSIEEVEKVFAEICKEGRWSGSDLRSIYLFVKQVRARLGAKKVEERIQKLNPSECPHRWQTKADNATMEIVVYCELCGWEYSRTAVAKLRESDGL